MGGGEILKKCRRFVFDISNFISCDRAAPKIPSLYYFISRRPPATN